MNKDLEVGTLVVLSEKSVWRRNKNNPVNTVGVIIPNTDKIWVKVRWGSIENVYPPSQSDLIPIEGNYHVGDVYPSMSRKKKYNKLEDIFKSLSEEDYIQLAKDKLYLQKHAVWPNNSLTHNITNTVMSTIFVDNATAQSIVESELNTYALKKLVCGRDNDETY